MKTHLRILSHAAMILLTGLGVSDLLAQDTPTHRGVLHIQQSQTTATPSTVPTGFPTFLAMYQVLDGAASPAEALSLTGTISLKNDSPKFSEVLWILVYWQGACPANDITFSQGPGTIWSAILKNPSQSTSSLAVDLRFDRPVPMTGCVGLFYGGGPLLAPTPVTMSANLDLVYQPAASNPNTVLDVGGEYCFGQTTGCQNVTNDTISGFAVPIPILTDGHLLELYGSISDSSFDGARDNGPIPTGDAWGASNDFYLLPGGCGPFGQNLNGQSFPNPVPLATLYGWLPDNALHLASVPLVDRIPSGRSGQVALQSQVQQIFSTPVRVNAGDCMVVIYGRTGNGASDNETQVHALIGR